MRDQRSGYAAPERPEAEAQSAAGPSCEATAHPAEAGPSATQAAAGQAMSWRGRALLLIVLLDCLLTAFAL
jgi:hypothetical protein